MTLPFVSRVAVCPSRGVDMSPVDVNVPRDCANAIEAGLAAPNKRRGTRIPLRDELIPLAVACMSFLQAALLSRILNRAVFKEGRLVTGP